MADFLLNSDLLSAIIAFILVLIPAVIIHELGHFGAARAVGITILEFGLGLPPRARRLFDWRGVEYTLNWLPLGGFVRPLGEDTVRQIGGEALDEDRKLAIERGNLNPKSVNEVSPLKRIFFFAAGALANFVLALALLTIVGLIGVPQIAGGRANIVFVGVGSPYADAGLLPGDVIEQVNGEYFATAAEAIGAIGASEGDATLSIRRADVADPIILTIPAGAISGAGQTNPLILGIAQDSPAAQAGLQPGDLVLAFNGDPISTREDLQTVTREHLGEEVTLSVWRNGALVDATLTPRSNPPEGQGAMGIEITTGAADTGFGLVAADGQLQQSLQPLTLGEALQFSVTRMADVVGQIASLPGRLLQGSADPNETRVVSVLGLSQVGGVFLQESIQQERPTIILEYIALISLALGITNLLPIPALDGGRILFVVIELIRGRPIAPEREGMVHMIGLLILLSLMAVVLGNDIANPITNLLR
ncbi:MAG TPA: RIP metalloprotease RseP [Candidatus Limnocylindrales bacterium]|nr:RIP metalloprotease RseP [Candidatus Limnocylindrales bacterium]